MVGARVEQASELMAGFAARTGLWNADGGRRYLWTDAFAVCNYLALARATGDAGGHRDSALQLVGAVHRVLGRHRPDDPRFGWLSGLGEAEGSEHPTAGGLRIGKPLPERGSGERFDERLEWERDGQYFHYLTRWAHALDQVARATGEPRFAGWARELIVTAHRCFAYAPRAGGPRRMRWKMSVDLARPLVPSMGQHDPLDGFVTCRQLEATAVRFGHATGEVAAAAMDFAPMIDRRALATADPLGLGGLLLDAARLEQIGGEPALRDDLLRAAAAGLQHLASQREVELPAELRLGFRELGLAIGLSALDLLASAAPEALAAVQRHAHLRGAIERFWLRPENQRAASWTGHADIHEVMLATSLLPDGVTRLF